MTNKQTSDYPNLLREASTVLDEEYHREKISVMMNEAADEIEALKREAEFICRKCGLRQDAPFNPNRVEAPF